MFKTQNHSRFFTPFALVIEERKFISFGQSNSNLIEKKWNVEARKIKFECEKLSRDFLKKTRNKKTRDLNDAFSQFIDN